MKTKILIEGIECYSFHGCMEEESKIGGRYRVDVLFDIDVEKAVVSDNLADTVDYVTVNKIVKEQMAIPSKLIEHAGGRILKKLSEAIPGKKTIELKIIKFNPPVNGYMQKAIVFLTEDYQ